MDATTNRPVAGAIVALEGSIAGPAASSPRAMTNAAGQFVFRRIARGTFFVTATRNGYVDGAYGRRRPGGTTLPLRVEVGQRVGDVVIAMWKFGAIGGAVTDEAGEPVIGVQLRAFQRRYVAGKRRIVQNGTAATDDRGIYRFAQLAPGDYMIAFVGREVSLPAGTAELLRTPLPPNDPRAAEIARERIALGGLVGAPGSPYSVPVAGGMVRQIDAALPVPPLADGSAAYIYPTQFYPNAPSAARATVVTIESGQQRDSVDFALRPTKSVKVSGVVIGPDGPVSMIALRLVPFGEDTLTDVEAATTMTGTDGAFTFLGVPAGQYTIKAIRVPRPAPAGPMTVTQIQVGSSTVMTSSTVGGGTPSPIPDDPTMFAEVPVPVANVDVADVIVPLQRGARITGRVEFEGSAERPDATRLSRIPVTMDRADAGVASPGALGNVPPGRVDETGAFKTYGLPAGKYLVRVGGGPPGWTLKSVISEGRDVSETPLDLRAADVANVVITFTDRPTRLTGNVRTAQGNPDRDALVVVFPPDPASWLEFGLNPRRLRSARPDKNGAYSIDALPPGDYIVAAVREDAVAQWQDPHVLEELARSGAQVRIGEGETRTQDIKTAGGQR